MTFIVLKNFGGGHKILSLTHLVVCNVSQHMFALLMMIEDKFEFESVCCLRSRNTCCLFSIINNFSMFVSAICVTSGLHHVP